MICIKTNAMYLVSKINKGSRKEEIILNKTNVMYIWSWTGYDNGKER